jgi:allantoinase
MEYDFVPLPHRPRLRWPDGKRLAVILTTNFEYWDMVKDTDRVIYPGGPGIVGGTLTGRIYDNPNWTWREYGHRVGVWRMFEAFETAGVPTSCTMNAKMGLERKAIIDHAVAKGYEIVAHNWEQQELLTDYQDDEAQERQVIRDTLRVVRETTGREARGWLSCSLRCTPQTVDLLAEEGLIFTCDLLNDDQPYLVRTRSGGTIVSIPYTSEVNDFTVFMRQGKDADGGFAVFREQFDQLYKESARTALHMCIGLHPHVIGQPFRIRALSQFLDYARQFDDVWFATREEIAEWILSGKGWD